MFVSMSQHHMENSQNSSFLINFFLIWRTLQGAERKPVQVYRISLFNKRKNNDKYVTNQMQLIYILMVKVRIVFEYCLHDRRS